MALCYHNRVDLLRQFDTDRADYGFYHVVFHPTEDRTELLQFMYDRTNYRVVSLNSLARIASIEQIRWIEDKGVTITNDAGIGYIEIQSIFITRKCPLVREWLY